MAAQLDKALHDAVMAHAVDLTRVEAAVRAHVARRLRSLRAELAALLGAAPPATLAEQRALLARANKAIAAAFDAIDERDLAPALRAVGETQAQAIVGALGQKRRVG